MNIVLLISIFLRIVGFGWSLYLWRRVRDWRMAFLAAAMLLMTIRQTGTFLEEIVEHNAIPDLADWQFHEIAGLAVSLLSLLAVVSLERLLAERQVQAAELVENSRRYEGMSHMQKVLFNELDHRVRNNLAGLLALVQIGRHVTTDVRAFSETLTNRIMAMKTVHELIANSEWRGADLRTLLEALSTQVVPQSERCERLKLDGPKVPVRSRQASALAMILQELLTNSNKHGGLSVPNGFIETQWEIVAEDDHAMTVQFSWRENGTRSSPKNGRGMGLDLVRGFARADFCGECEFCFDPPGFRCELVLRIEKSPNALAAAADHTGLTTVT